MDAAGKVDELPLSQPLTDNLLVEVVCEIPEAVCSVTPSMVMKWGVDADTVFVIAKANLRLSLQKRLSRGTPVALEEFTAQSGVTEDQLLARTRPGLQDTPVVPPASANGAARLISKMTYADLGFAEFEAYPGLYRESDKDWFSPGRILIPDWIRMLKLQGDPIAMVTHEGRLLVTGSDNSEGLRGMAEIANRREPLGHGVSQIPIRLTADGWRTYQPDSTHSAYQAFRNLYVRELAAAYDSQRKRARKSLIGVFPAAMMFESDGKLRTECMWVECPADLFLPKTDYVMFMKINPFGFMRLNPTSSPVVGAELVPWASVVDIVGHLMELTDFTPPRYRVTSYPTDDEITRLAATSEKRFST